MDAAGFEISENNWSSREVKPPTVQEKWRTIILHPTIHVIGAAVGSRISARIRALKCVLKPPHPTLSPSGGEGF